MMLLNAVIAEASIGGNLATALTSEKLFKMLGASVSSSVKWVDCCED